MRGPREVLQELKWRDGALETAEVYYIHRGAPGDSRIVPGRDIRALERSFLVLRGDRRIPFHRVYRIDAGGRTRWTRRGFDVPPGEHLS